MAKNTHRKSLRNRRTDNDIPDFPLIYTRHATERTRENNLPTFEVLPHSAAFIDIDHERGGSRYLIAHGRGAICLVISDYEDRVVITAYDPRRRSDWW